MGVGFGVQESGCRISGVGFRLCIRDKAFWAFDWVFGFGLRVEGFDAG